MKHLGDIKKINGAEIEPVDVVTGGSPCQDLSVAGKRAGLDGERSGLFMEQIRVIKEMREHDKASGRTDEFIRPRYMVWENVIGAISSNGGGRLQVRPRRDGADRRAVRLYSSTYRKVDSERVHHGRRMVNRLESTRRAVLGSTPAKKTYRSCRRFWRKKRRRNTICQKRLVAGF